MKIFIVNGKSASGKSTIEKMICNIAKENNEKIKILSTIDYVKDIAKTFGWNGEKEKKDRKMLSDLKDLLTEWNDIPHKVINRNIEKAQLDGYTAVFIDSREPADIKRFVEEYNAITILIERWEKDFIVGNHADDNVYDYNYDCYINNTRGLEELRQEAQIFYDCFIKEEEY